MQFLFRYANPHNFMRLSGAVLPYAAIATVLCLAAGLYLGFSVPPDYQQPAEFVLARLMYPPHPYGMFGMGWGDWLHGRTSWTNDYPRADRHFVAAVRRLTRVNVRTVEQPVKGGKRIITGGSADFFGEIVDRGVGLG